MVFAKRTALSLLIASLLAPGVQAVGGVPTPAALPILTVPKSEQVTSGSSTQPKKLVVTGATLGEVTKPVVISNVKPAPPVPLSPDAQAPSESSLPPVVPATDAASVKAPAGPEAIKVLVQSPAKKSVKRRNSTATSPEDPTGNKKPEITGVVVEKRGYYDSVKLIPISDRDYNRIVFPEPIVKGRMPAGTKLGEEIVYLSGNRAMMFQLALGQSKVIQLVVELASGRVETLYLKPQAVPGTVHRVDGALDAAPTQKKGRGSAQIVAQHSPHSEAVAILKNFVRGEIPSSFEAVEPPVMTQFDKFSVVPAGAWTDGADYKVYIFQLIANKGQSAVVAPSQFYREGVRSVMVDGDEVSEDLSPYVYVVEDLNHGE